MRLPFPMFIFSGVLALTSGGGGANADDSIVIDAQCIVMAMGHQISTTRIRSMHAEVTSDLHAVMNIFDMSCLQNIINFGGLGHFGLSGFLNQYAGALCNAVRDWLTATTGEQSIGPAGQMLAHHAMGLQPRQKESGERAVGTGR